MKTTKSTSSPISTKGLLHLSKRGRPSFSDRTKIKSRSMSIVLSDDAYKLLIDRAKIEKRPKAALARIIIEEALSTANG